MTFNFSIFSVLRSWILLRPFLDITACLFGAGMLESMLEPHMSKSGASPGDVEVTFLLYGSAYLFGNFGIGWVRLLFIAAHKAF